jgi:pimeloyl-ACP methyl ester carboxylesterase
MTWTIRPRSDHGPLAAITAGDGPLVVLIHGVGLRAEAWNAQIDALSHRFRVIAVDLPGHGHSAALGPDPQMSDFTNAVVASFQGAACVIGHSFGAMIALDLAIRYPARVRGVVALNAIYRRDTDARVAVMARADALDGRTISDPSATLDRWFGAASLPERAACAAWLNAVDPSGYRAAYRVFAREDGPSDRGLVTLGCPALFITGEKEPNSTPTMSRQMAAHVADGQAEVIADAAHMLPMTHAPQVNSKLTQFLQERGQ